MRRTIGILLLALIGLGLLELTPAEVTHDEIRGTIQSLIYSYNQLDNKLERHEHRERALGELMKKAMQALQKGQKNLEPINGIFARLDERVSQIETMLIAQEEKYNIQTDKLGETLEHIFKWMRENDECFRRPPVPTGNSAMAAPAPIVAAPAIPIEFVQQQEQTNKQLLEQVKQLTANVDKLLDSSQNMLAQTELAVKSVPSTAEMLLKIEDKLGSYSVATPAPLAAEPIDNSEFENKVFEKFDELSTGMAELKSLPQPSKELSTADKEFIHGLANETLTALQSVKLESISVADKALAQAASNMRAAEENNADNTAKLLESVSNSTALAVKFYDEVNSSYSKLSEALDMIGTFNNILLTNSEYVLDTQRKVEFGTLQVVQKISDLLDKQRDEVTALLKERFDNVDESILANQLEAVQNLSSLIEAEISHVWRQISIMHGEITDSKDLLNLLHGRNEAYVNTTFSTMDSMSSKVEEIKGRMLDMDSNLNFLLGKLSVMSQEFRNIKIGLAESLEQLRNTFHTMQEKMPPQGPGPHTIAKNEYETEVNLLKKRQTS